MIDGLLGSACNDLLSGLTTPEITSSLRMQDSTKDAKAVRWIKFLQIGVSVMSDAGEEFQLESPAASIL